MVEFFVFNFIDSKKLKIQTNESDESNFFAKTKEPTIYAIIFLFAFMTFNGFNS